MKQGLHRALCEEATGTREQDVPGAKGQRTVGSRGSIAGTTNSLRMRHPQTSQKSQEEEGRGARRCPKVKIQLGGHFAPGRQG